MSDEKKMIINRSAVKEYVKSKKSNDKTVQSGQDFIDELNAKIYELIDGAIGRASCNKRATLRSYDI